MSTRTPLNVTDDERDELRRRAKHPSTRQAMAMRRKVILLDEQGLTYAAIGDKLELREQTVLKWRNRFLKHRLAGLSDNPRPGRTRTITNEKIAEVVRVTLEEKPRGEASSRLSRAGTAPARHRIPGDRRRCRPLR